MATRRKTAKKATKSRKKSTTRRPDDGLIKRLTKLEEHARETSKWLAHYAKTNSDWLGLLHDWVISVDKALEDRFSLADPPPKPPSWDKPPKPPR